jgi:hypothetical protein
MTSRGASSQGKRDRGGPAARAQVDKVCVPWKMRGRSNGLEQEPIDGLVGIRE